MKISEVRKYQLAQVELLDYIDRLCAELGIQYYLGGGTLLGAVRHGGCIPWDLDVDIAMKRVDYEALHRYFETHSSDRFVYQHYSNNPYHFSPHAILRIRGTHIYYTGVDFGKYAKGDNGVYLDIVSIDEAPSEPKLRHKQEKQVNLLKKLVYYKVSPEYSNITTLKRWGKKCFRLAMSVVPMRYLLKKMDDVMQRHNGCNSGLLVSLAGRYSYEKEMHPAEVFGEPVRIGYEGLMLCAPVDADAYLSHVYGDYMKLPPENERGVDLNRIGSIDYGTEESADDQ